MDLTSLTDENLLKRTESIAGNLRIATTALLHHLSEVERRRLFAKVGCSSLFDYCVRALKMTEAQAGRRVAASRALREFPEIESKINSGSLSLSAISQAQVFFRNETKAEMPLDNVDRRDILQQLENKTTRQAEKFLLARSSRPEEFIKERIRQVSKSITEIKCGVDEETMDNLARLREIWSYEIPDANHSQLIKKSSRFCREKLDPDLKTVKARKDSQHAASPAPEMQRVTKTGELGGQLGSPAGEDQPAIPTSGETSEKVILKNPRPSRYIPASARDEVWRRDKAICTFVDPESGRPCLSRYRLNIDHIVPFANGGTNTADNLRLRCFAHNQWHAMQSFGPEVLKFGVKARD